MNLCLTLLLVYYVHSIVNLLPQKPQQDGFVLIFKSAKSYIMFLDGVNLDGLITYHKSSISQGKEPFNYYINTLPHKQTNFNDLECGKYGANNLRRTNWGNLILFWNYTYGMIRT